MIETNKKIAFVITFFGDGSVVSSETAWMPRNKEDVSRFVGNMALQESLVRAWGLRAIAAAEVEEAHLMRLLDQQADERRPQ